MRAEIIDTQMNTGYEYGKRLQNAFSKIMGSEPKEICPHNRTLRASWFDTKLGPMIAIADEGTLYLLEFVDRPAVELQVKRLRLQTKTAIIREITDPILSIRLEIVAYFEGRLKTFKTPINLLGSPFQKNIWEELLRIPYGTTRSYREQAASVGKNKAYRAVAKANGANRLAIIVPCHRIIRSNGALGGYSGGIRRKKWLLEHEALYR